MSKTAPTLAEFLAGAEILIPVKDGDYLLGVKYDSAVRRFTLRNPVNGEWRYSRSTYSVLKCCDIYYEITPKSRNSV